MGDADVLIAGAGIGGLTAALTLHARGIGATVLESARGLHPLGLGINLLPHAVRELSDLGLDEQLSRIAVAPAAIAYFGTDGELLYREPRGIDGAYGWPQYSVHRGELQMLLLDAVRDRLGPDAVRVDSRVTGFKESTGAVHVQLATGDALAAALVGADGIKSVIRAQLHPGGDPLLWSGKRMWRGAVAGELFLDGRTMAIANAADGVELVVYPIGGDLINWVLIIPESEPGPLVGDAKWNDPGDSARVLPHLGGWHLGWLDICDLVRRTIEPLQYPMVDRDPLPWWGRGRVTLLGDAAHPMYPIGANGGAQAILDARILADELARDPEAGLRAYEDKRRAATTDVVVANREMHGARGGGGDEIARVTAKYRRDTRADWC